MKYTLFLVSTKSGKAHVEVSNLSDRLSSRSVSATISKANKNLLIPVNCDGSATAGSKSPITPLRYVITYTGKGSYEGKTSVFYVFQDETNKARSEYYVFGLQNFFGGSLPARTLFKHKGVDLETKFWPSGYDVVTAGNYPNVTLENGYKAIYDAVVAANSTLYSDPYISSTWRAPYHNATISTSQTSSSNLSDHCKGEAIDLRPRGVGQTPQNYKDDWTTITGLSAASFFLLEQKGTPIRRKGTSANTNSDGWYFTGNYDSENNKIFWDRLINYDGQNIEEGYVKATHFHLAK